ncbi:MAG: AgmX/PglI C-terminal domain-containing protein [Myxococcales bacterium]|nr:AgmX/PglI C-terminal domain-containing protein [Myxococcales bacterium]
MSSREREGANKSHGAKVLRIGIVQRGKIIEERELKKRETVTIGSGPRCSFQVTSEKLPRIFELFEFDGKAYYLRFDESVEGRLQIEDEPVGDFKMLAKRGLVVQRGSKKGVRLTDKSRGKVILADGDITILFQFKSRVLLPSRPVLPPQVRGGVFTNLDIQFTSILVVVGLLLMSVLTYARNLPYVEPKSIDEISETYQRLIMPEREPELPQPKEAPVQAKAETKVKEPQKEEKTKKTPKKKEVAKDRPRDQPSRDNSKQRRRQRAKQQVAGRGLLGVIGTTKVGGGGALADVFKEGGASRSMQAAFSGIKGVDLATQQTGRTRGGAGGNAVGVGKLSTRGGGDVSAGKKSETRVSGELDAQTPEVDGSLDPASIRRVMNRKKSGIKACYENALKRNRKLSGKLVISFEIDARGRLQNLDFGGSLNSKTVEQCIKKISRSWRFPRPRGGSVFVDYPIVFTPST